MTKKVRRAAASAKKAVAEEAKEALEDVTEVAENVTESSKDVVKKVTKEISGKKCCRSKKNVRNWFIVIVFVALVFFAYSALTKSVPAVSGLFGGIVSGDTVDASDERQWGYAVGSIIGEQVVQMLEQAPGADEMDMKMFVRGIEDAVLAVEKPLLSQEQVQELLEGRMQMEQDKMIEVAQKNSAASDAFVQEYAQKGGVQKLEGGTLYSVITQGAGARVGTRDAQIHYTGKHIDGTEFDSSRDGEPIVLKADTVVPGFGEAIKAMRVGDKWEIVIPADQAYGEQGMPLAGIEPNEALVFELEIIDLDR